MPIRRRDKPSAEAPQIAISNAIGEREISSKHRELKNNNFDLGAPLGRFDVAGDGGLVRRFTSGNIYWHPDTGAHEVHGGILQKYVQMGGPNAHPESGQSELGFPITDERSVTIEMEGRPTSTFQRGAIRWVKGIGGVAVYGDFFGGFIELVKKPVDGRRALSWPIAEPIRVANGVALYFKRQIFYSGPETNNEITRIMTRWPSYVKLKL